ncbi:50S ribosomal protein L11 methyltransferase [Tenuibacillus multivorans]|uniref:Ribosomal protein L11 methyltransferase n=1 Tax=Tenuibacillus multivorans TaxID=237069 RepID=A0A1G9ZDZ9_9BACI|nr:50S ribosomal protein L11 methyltransferase [Tenuibacillus multivorans]GEL78327.1 ribosomal protein L11 methyltransferase [Tenuibacillus multivorans]SDN19559.1 ribosomal protein L11 methyltransferase [Tenuibacillus multivorans]
MKWSELKVHTTNEAIEPVSNILHESGASGVVIVDPMDLDKDDVTLFGSVYELDPTNYPDEGVYIKAYLPMNSFLGETVDAIKESINNLVKFDIDIGENNITISEVNEEEWSTAWKKYYKPVKISEKITIIPTWEEYEPVSSDEIIIELDPGMAFGTGTHPTTVLSIQALEQYVNEGDVVYDVGSGSGVLTIAAALLGASHIKAFDLDEIAVKSTTINVKLNHVQDRMEAKQNNLLNGVEPGADLIVSNILAEIILQFVDDAYHKLNPGGYFITSGIIQGKKNEVKEQLELNGFDIIEVNQMEDWISMVAKKPE